MVDDRPFVERLRDALREELGREPTSLDLCGDGEGPPDWAIAYRDMMADDVRALRRLRAEAANGGRRTDA